MNKLSLVGMQLAEKYKENFDVSSEGPSSGNSFKFLFQGSSSVQVSLEKSWYKMKEKVEITTVKEPDRPIQNPADLHTLTVFSQY